MQTHTKRSLTEALKQVLLAGSDRGPTIGELVKTIGDKGFGLLLVVLSMPSALPIPAPGYSTPFGIAVALIALQMLCGRRSVWLPQRIMVVRIQPAIAEKMIGAVSRFLRRVERFIRPRHLWTYSSMGLSALALLIIIMAALMVLPIPLTNTFPAMVIFMIGVGLTEEDGLLAIAASFVGACATALYGVIIYLMIRQGPQAISNLKDWLLDWIH
jgi:hypothetical protein